MSTSEKPVKVNIGFHGGQVVPARVKPAELTRLKEALGGGGWHELTSEDGILLKFDLTRVDYLLIDDAEHRVGF